MKTLLNMTIAASLCCLLITAPALAQSTATTQTATTHVKKLPKKHKAVKSPSAHPKASEVCLSCIGHAQSKAD